MPQALLSLFYKQTETQVTQSDWQTLKSKAQVWFPTVHTLYDVISRCHASQSWMIPLPKTRHPGFNPEILFHCLHGFFLQHLPMHFTHIAQLPGYTVGCQNGMKSLSWQVTTMPGSLLKYFHSIYSRRDPSPSLLASVLWLSIFSFSYRWSDIVYLSAIPLLE